jgi:hypothetical protein
MILLQIGLRQLKIEKNIFFTIHFCILPNVIVK